MLKDQSIFSKATMYMAATLKMDSITTHVFLGNSSTFQDSYFVEQLGFQKLPKGRDTLDDKIKASRNSPLENLNSYHRVLINQCVISAYFFLTAQT